MSGTPTSRSRLWLTAAAAFCTYFCMYAFRKPFTAMTYEGLQVGGFNLKTTLIIAQLLGYMLSKFIGIPVIAQIESRHRSVTILGLIAIAELALVGFALVPMSLKPVMMFLNGLPLGMLFGLVLGFLEGRQQTEALVAALCSSFIASSGVVKSVGQWLVQTAGVDQFQMPLLTGLLFVPGLLVSVWILHRAPPPDTADVTARRERKPMNREQQLAFLVSYWPGLALLVAVYIALTIVRTIRDDFGAELWREMGLGQSSSLFARSETLVAVCVTALMGLSIWITDNRWASRVTNAVMCLAFGLILIATVTKQAELIAPFSFMVLCGIGLYIPYVAFHTSVFERLIACSTRTCNLGFLMYVADAIGYLGYAAVMLSLTSWGHGAELLTLFLWLLNLVSVGSLIALMLATLYFERALNLEQRSVVDPINPVPRLDTPTDLSASGPQQVPAPIA